MTIQHRFSSWADLSGMARSPFFGTGPEVIGPDRARPPRPLLSQEALFTQSNARVLLGQAPDGTLRFVARTLRAYAVTPNRLGFGPGIYGGFDLALYVGDLGFEVVPDGQEAAMPAAGATWRTAYGDAFLPVTVGRLGNLDALVTSFAPVASDRAAAPLAPAPLPGPSGVFHVIRLVNSGDEPFRGKVRLRTKARLVAGYHELEERMESSAAPEVVMPRHDILILSRPFGAVGLYLEHAPWSHPAPGTFLAERKLDLPPGGEAVFAACVAMGADAGEVMPLLAGMHALAPLEWLNLTAAFWRERLGVLEVRGGDDDEAARMSRDFYHRCLLDNFNCVQTDAGGRVVALWQGGPSHGPGLTWGIDIEPTALSILTVCPELAKQVLLFALDRHRAPGASPDHSLPILVGPVILAREYLQTTGDVAFLQDSPEVVAALEATIRDVLALQSPREPLFPTRYSSDGWVGRRYDYGTNVKVWYALESMAYVSKRLGRSAEATVLTDLAQRLREAVGRCMTAQGPFGTQISGGTNLGEAVDDMYLPESALYYDGEDTSSMLAPALGFCRQEEPAWVNYHRFARSLWCEAYDPEFDVLVWPPGEATSVDGTGFISRVGGSVTRAEMVEAFANLWQGGVDDATGSIFWWPRGRDGKRSLTRCSQGQGAWSWLYRRQWLGLNVDAVDRTLTLMPRGLPTRVAWSGLRGGPWAFDVEYEETPAGSRARMVNGSDRPWLFRVGFRPFGAGAESEPLWREQTVAPGATVEWTAPARPERSTAEWGRRQMWAREDKLYADRDGITLRRFGSALLWGWGETVWDYSDKPLALRFLVHNGTGADWTDLDVALTCPPGWRARVRPCGYWEAGGPWAGQARYRLDALPSPGRTVAPFWIEPIERLAWDWSYRRGSFHAATQRGPGLTVPVRGMDEARTDEFAVELTARAGREPVRRRLAVPVALVPAVGLT